MTPQQAIQALKHSGMSKAEIHSLVDSAFKKNGDPKKDWEFYKALWCLTETENGEVITEDEAYKRMRYKKAKQEEELAYREKLNSKEWWRRPPPKENNENT